MKKIALSTLVICSALSTVAHAQTSVTVYGQIDEAIAVGVGSGKGTTTQLVNGGLRASRIGFMGSEDLGGGLRTIFLLESGFNANNGAQTQPGLIFGRKAYVGFSSSTYGTAIAGRMYTLSYSTVDFFDPQLGIGGGNDNMFTRGGTRWSNTLRYDSPTFGGFSGAAAYALPEGVASRKHEELLTYEHGPLVIKLVRSDQNGANNTLADHNTFLGASYDFGVIRTVAGYQINRGPGGDQPDTKYNVALIGASVPTGEHSVVGATYIRANDQTPANNNAQQFAISYQYFLSKRTTLYTSYTHIHNQNGTLLYVTGDTTPGAPTEYNVGINHTF